MTLDYHTPAAIAKTAAVGGPTWGSRLRLLLLVVVMAALLVTPMVVPVTRHEEGAKVVYTFPRWEVGALATGGFIALALLWRFRKGINLKLGLALVALGLGLPVLHLPSLLLSYVEVDDDHFEARYGSWESFTRPDVRFDDLREIRQLVAVNADGRGLTTDLVCVQKSGAELRYFVNHVMMEAALPEILSRARRHKILLLEERRQQ
jgi:hypothetical protein